MDAEALLKVLDKRLSGVERTLDTIAKDMRGYGDFDKRITALEKVVEGVKLMTKNHDSVIKAMSSGSDQKAVEEAKRELARLERRSSDHEKKLDEAYAAQSRAPNARDFEQAKTDIEKLTKQRDQMKASIDAVALAQTKAQMAIQTKLEKEIQQQKDQLDKQKDEIDKIVQAARAQSEKNVERAYLDSRLKALEAQIGAVMAGAGRR